MKKLLSIILSAIMLLSLTSCTKADAAWQEQFDRGVRYLNNLEYESAIQSFNEAIKIDPKKENAYIALAGTYYEQGDTAKALETIDTAISTAGSSENLEETKQQIENNSFSTNETVTDLVIDNATVKTERVDNEDGSYTEKAIDKDKNVLKETLYNADGTVLGVIVSEYNEKGKKTADTHYGTNGLAYEKTEYNEKGTKIRYIRYLSYADPARPQTYFLLWETYNETGAVDSYTLSNSNADNHPELMKIWKADTSRFSKDDFKAMSVIDWEIFEYDANGRCVSKKARSEWDGHGKQITFKYDSKGNLVASSVSMMMYTWENEYWPNGNVSKVVTYSAEEFSSVIYYYENGAIKSETFIYDNGNCADGYEYDEKGNLVKEIEYHYAPDQANKYVNEQSLENRVFKYIEHEYDRSNRLIKSTYYYNKDIDCWAIYEYDAQGRLAKTYVYDMWGELIYVDD